jgi:hypothetical protein
MTQQLMDLQEQFDDLVSVSEQEYFINLNLVHASDAALAKDLILTRDPRPTDDLMQSEMSHHMEI